MTIISERLIDNRTVLTLDTGMSERMFAKARLSRTIGTPGIIMNTDGTVENWVPEGTWKNEADTGETTLVYGPAFSRLSLLGAVTSSNREGAWRTVHAALSLINRCFILGTIAAETLTAIAGAGPEALLVADDGRLLFLGKDLYVRCLNAHGEAVTVDNRLSWIHPDYRSMNPTRALAFMAGTLAYRILSGTVPFMSSETDGMESVTRSMRQGNFEPLELALWQVRKDVAVCVNTLVSTDLATSTDTLLAFGPEYSSLIDTGKTGKDIPGDFLEQKKNAAERRNFRARRKLFFQVHRRSFAVGGIIGLFTLVLLATFLNDLRLKPSTRGLTPEEVVRGYYRAIGTMDQEIPQQYALSKVKPAYLDLVTNLYVTTRMRQNYEKDYGIMTPDEVLQGGIPGKKNVFGISGLAVERIGAEKTDEVYEVIFYLWAPVAEDDATVEDATGGQLTIYRYRERVSVGIHGKKLKITAIENLERQPVETSLDRLLSIIAEGKAAELDYVGSNGSL